MSTARTWQPVVGHAAPDAAPLVVRLAAQTRGVAADCRNLPRYLAKYCAVVLAALGLLQIWQASGDGPMPAFRSLHPSKNLDPYRTSHPRSIFADTSNAARWQALAPAMAILDEVNPEVAAWVRRTHQTGKLQFHKLARAKSGPTGQLGERV